MMRENRMETAARRHTDAREKALMAIANLLLPSSNVFNFVVGSFFACLSLISLFFQKDGEVASQKVAEYLFKKSDQNIIKPEKKVSITTIP